MSTTPARTLWDLKIDAAPPRARRFDGETIDEERDSERLSRLLDRVRTLMLDGKYRTLRQIADATGGSEASVSARLRDLRKARFGGYTVERRNIEGGLFEYQVKR